MEAKALVDTQAKGQVKAQVKTLGDTLMNVGSKEEPGQTRRAQASRVVEKVGKLFKKPA